MKCVHCGRTDTDKPVQCVCYTWFMRTCGVCLATVLIGLVCCMYCTFIMVSISKQNTGRSQHSQQNVAKDGYRDSTPTQVEETKTLEMSFAIRSKREAKEQKKRKEKRRKGRGERGKRTQAAHFVLRKGLSDIGADCPPGSNTRKSGSDMKRTLDVFELATFIKAKTNPFNVMGGKFIAKKKGLYLVYAQVLFEDCKAYEVMRIVQNRRVGNEEIVIQEHFCFVGVPKAKEGYNNTCSMTSLFFLEANDYLSVMNYYPEVHINYRSNSTFFGAIYLR